MALCKLINNLTAMTKLKKQASGAQLKAMTKIKSLQRLPIGVSKGICVSARTLHTHSTVQLCYLITFAILSELIFKTALLVLGICRHIPFFDL